MFLCCLKVLISACLLAWCGEIKSALGEDRMLKSQQMDLSFPQEYWVLVSWDSLQHYEFPCLQTSWQAGK